MVAIDQIPAKYTFDTETGAAVEFFPNKPIRAQIQSSPDQKSGLSIMVHAMKNGYPSARTKRQWLKAVNSLPKSKE